jgi:hypothetical protein
MGHATTLSPDASGPRAGTRRVRESSWRGPQCQNVGVSDLIDTTEMYLRTIYELIEEGIVPLRARIAERLHQSGPTVSRPLPGWSATGCSPSRATATSS